MGCQDTFIIIVCQGTAIYTVTLGITSKSEVIDFPRMELFGEVLETSPKSFVFASSADLCWGLDCWLLWCNL